MHFYGKKVLVCGMARSGQAAAALLCDLGADVTVQDIQKKIDWAYDPHKKGLTLYLGQNPDNIVDEFDLVIISPGLSIYLPFVQKAKSLGIPIWGESELAFRYCSCPVVAITGTNGKTTVTTLVGEILKKHNPKTIVAGNIGIPLTSMVKKLTPESVVVAEISSFQLETIDGFRPSVSAVLNMTEDHLDRHKDMETYIKMKSRIFENQRHPNIAVLNYDNPITREMKPNCQVVWFSQSNVLPMGVYQRDGNIYARMGLYESEELITSLRGLTLMTENALAATALALCAGVPVIYIAEGLRAFKGVPHRLEQVANIRGVRYFNDSKATNIDSAIKALGSVSGQIVLIGGGYDKNTDFGPWIKAFAGKVERLILIGQTAAQIIKTCQTYGFSAYERAESLQEAVKMAAISAKPGQAVLLSPACASMDMFKNYEERGDIFRSCVEALI